MTLAELAERWSHAQAAERANFQSYLIELCGALGVEPPRPAGSGFEFEFPIRITNRDGSESTNFVDLYKAGFFALEAKHGGSADPNDLLLRKAFGQVRSYVGHLPHERPPYLLVLDVGRTLLVWDRWNGDYGGFNAARRIDLARLHQNPDDAALLRDIWTDPAARDPRARAAAVTRELAERLATLATDLEAQGFTQEVVARFLMRCVFTMFAEDVGLLADEPFRRLIDEVALADPAEFVPAAEELWRAMDEGRRFGVRRLLRFNGHFFRNAEALPLGRPALLLLLEASRADWREVEPSIFGTLLTRALDPEERHRLGAEYTPRAFVERVVRPTVEEPVRARWTQVQAEVLQLREARKNKDAVQRLRDFHGWLRGLQILDPACGSGNFLYVTLALLKRIELEVLREIEAITGQPELGLDEVSPEQFHGIEVKPWAREIAELTLWIGYHQFWLEHHQGVNPPQPVLKDTGTLEMRDAVLAWDTIVEDPTRSRPDPAPRIPHQVTGKLVPDPEARLPYYEYRGARAAEWPRADFIVGNPPYMGQARMRDAFGDGYVEALRATYDNVPQSADYVMYWWYRAAHEVAAGRTIRAGLITTNTITQRQNRVVIADAVREGASVVWAVADHPWVDEAGGAAVRVAMTVLGHQPTRATLVRVNNDAEITSETVVPSLNSDLTAHVDVTAAAAVPLLANSGLAYRGFQLIGAGFILRPEEVAALGEAPTPSPVGPPSPNPSPARGEGNEDGAAVLPSPLRGGAGGGGLVRPYRNGKDLTSRPRGVSVIDFGLRNEDEARAHPVLFDLVRDRVKPERDANARAGYRDSWWRFGEPRRELRVALQGRPRYIATPETAKYRFFTFLEAEVAPDNMLVCIASEDAFHLGVLSSMIHITWALAAGGRLGVGNDPRYNKTVCFDPFPFPDPEPELRAQIAELAERLDQHRKDAIARDERVTMTGIYNIVTKLRSDEVFTPAERAVHQVIAGRVLREMHQELDSLVAQAYGWRWPANKPEILSRLVELLEEREAEEKAGKVRWLRPDYQIPRFGAAAGATPSELDLRAAHVTEAKPSALPWPATVLDQIAALQHLAANSPVTTEEAAAAFTGARRDMVARHLETLALMGELRVTPDGRYQLAA